MSISYNLRRLRGKSKKSQQEIADLLEVDRRTYINWENGENDIKSEFIAKIFNVEIKDLFEDSKSNINIQQENKENKDNSINGLIFVLSDKNSVEKLVEILKNNSIKL